MAPPRRTAQPLVVVVAGPNGAGMLRRIDGLSREKHDFAFETTLASRSFAPRLRRMRASGYRVDIAFLSLPSPDMAVARVAERVRGGGHDVPEPVVRRRFVAGLRNLLGPRPIALREEAGRLEILDPSAWSRLLAYLP